jgi:HNH endonuclease
MKCTVDNCSRDAKYKGMCGMHYKRNWRYGSPDTIHVMHRLPEAKCSMEGCDEPIAHSNGYCKIHNQRLYRYGRVDNIIGLKGSGTLNVDGYWVICGEYEHRIVAERKLGRRLKEGEVVHHIDGDRLNNDPDNLEILSSQSEHMKLHMRKAKTTKRDS